MSELKQFVLPDVGEGLTEGEVLRWLVAVGEKVVVNQPLVEVETAKAAVELPSPYAGTVTELHAEAGAVLPVGAPLVTLSVDSPASPNSPASPDSGARVPSLGSIEESVPSAASAGGGSGPVLVGYGVTESTTKRRPRVLRGDPHGTARPEAGPPGEAVKPMRHGGLEVAREIERKLAEHEASPAVRTKPPVRRLAKQLGVDLTQVRPTGHDGVITRADVESAAALLPGAPGSAGSLGTGTFIEPSEGTLAPKPGGGGGGAGVSELRDYREDVRGVTRLMAEAMARSAFTAPHVTEWLDVDVSRSVELLERLRRSPVFDGVRVTPMLLVARAVLAAMRRTPILNAVFDADASQIVHRGAVNLGIAAATPRGLVVPSIKAADRLSLPALAGALADLTQTAKAGRSTPADLTGGTFTITNVGALGVDGGTPIINPGESAILAAGAWRDKPWAYRGQVVVRTVCTLSLSFDHRIIDGATGSRFLVDVASLLEEPAADLAW